jgi:hypothetical protein
MKPFHYFCLGAILSSLLFELLSFSSTLRLSSKQESSSSTTTSGGDGITSNGNDFTNEKNRRTPKLADGCYHVFLDVGSNIGVTGRMLLEPHLYPKVQEVTKQQQQRMHLQEQQQLKRRLRRRKSNANANTTNTTTENTHNEYKFTSARQFFTYQFGPEHSRIPTQYCIFAFEPNPTHTARQLELQSAYTAMGWHYHFIQAGVSDTSGSMTFYHVGRGDKLLERGFTTNKNKCNCTAKTGGKEKECPEEIVEVVRLSDWIDREVHGRIIPAITTSATTSSSASSSTTTETTTKTTAVMVLPPKVVMKMDIEMAEWLVLPDLLTSGVLCRDVDAMLAEFHTGGRHKNEFPIQFASQPPQPQSEQSQLQQMQQQQLQSSASNNATTMSSWTLESYLDAEQLKHEMMNMILHNPNCKTLVVEGDDESYGRDGMPWPSLATPSSSEVSSTSGPQEQQTSPKEKDARKR